MRELDEREHSCPTPLVNTIAALKEIAENDKVVVKVRGDVPLQNIKRFADGKNLPIEIKEMGNNEFEIIITKIHNFDDNDSSKNCNCGKGKLVVSISSDMMGVGDEVLGKNLMKSFVLALTKQENLPDIIIFYNRGAYLTTEGSECLEDLKIMETQGTKIFTCGTCLEYYKLKEKLVVGEITNMYDIVNMMESAKTLIKP